MRQSESGGKEHSAAFDWETTENDGGRTVEGISVELRQEHCRVGANGGEQAAEQVPGAIEMAYDNYNALVIGFGPSEKASLAVFSIVLYPRYVSLAFLQGAGLPDPAKRPQGDGKVVRAVRITTANMLEEPEIRKLIRSRNENWSSNPFPRNSNRETR